MAAKCCEWYMICDVILRVCHFEEVTLSSNSDWWFLFMYQNGEKFQFEMNEILLIYLTFIWPQINPFHQTFFSFFSFFPLQSSFIFFLLPLLLSLILTFYMLSEASKHGLFSNCRWQIAYLSHFYLTWHI